MKGLQNLWRLRHSALANTIILLFLVFGVAPAVLLYFTLQHVFISQQKDSIGSFQAENANRLAQNVSAYLNQSLSRLQQFSDQIQNDIFSPHLAWKLDEFLLDHPDYDQLIVLDSLGREVWKTASDYSGLAADLKDRRHDPNIQLALSGAVLKLPADPLPGSYIPRMKFLVPLRNAQGLPGILEARMDLVPLLARVAPPHVGKDSYAYIIGADGRLIAAQDFSAHQNQRTLSTLPIVQAFLAGRMGVWDYTGCQGRTVIGASAMVPATGWGVVVESIRPTVYGYGYYAIVFFLALFAFTIITAIFIGLMFSQRRLIEPLREVQQGMDAVGQGFWPPALGVHGGDELAQLAQAFDKMVRRLKKFRVARQPDSRDTMAQKVTEEALRHREATLRSLFRTVPVGLGFLQQWNIIGGNEAFCQMLGSTEAHMTGRNLGEFFVNQADYLQLLDYVSRTLEGAETAAAEGRWRRQDGQVRDVFLKFAVIDKADPNSDLILAALDITDQKKMEADRLRLDKLESVGILAGGIAHDFNNILTIILGNIELVSLDLKKSDKGVEWLREAEQACHRARHLAKQLLSLAKGGPPAQKSVAVAELLHNVVPLALSGSNSTVKFSLDEDVWPVDIDADQIHQVFNSILINADQAMPQGGLITILVRNVLVSPLHPLPLPEGRYVKFSFIDQGMGINPQDLEKIFDPYFSTKQIGNGLGLTAALSIVKNHQGHIAVESEVGQGTTVQVYLPAAPAASLPQATKISTMPLRGQGRILVMDDEASIRELLGHMLFKLGYEAVCVKDGRQTLQAYQLAWKNNAPFDAVILDLTIPGGLGGKETLELLRELDPNLVAIVSSGYGDDPIMADYHQYGFHGAIAKPYKISELASVLYNVLAEKPAGPERIRSHVPPLADADRF